MAYPCNLEGAVGRNVPGNIHSAHKKAELCHLQRADWRLMHGHEGWLQAAKWNRANLYKKLARPQIDKEDNHCIATLVIATSNCGYGCPRAQLEQRNMMLQVLMRLRRIYHLHAKAQGPARYVTECS